MSLWEYANPVKFLKISDKVLPFFVSFSMSRKMASFGVGQSVGNPKTCENVVFV